MRPQTRRRLATAAAAVALTAGITVGSVSAAQAAAFTQNLSFYGHSRSEALSNMQEFGPNNDAECTFISLASFEQEILGAPGQFETIWVATARCTWQ